MSVSRHTINEAMQLLNHIPREYHLTDFLNDRSFINSIKDIITTKNCSYLGNPIEIRTVFIDKKSRK